MAIEITCLKDGNDRVFVADRPDDPTLPAPGSRHHLDSRYIALGRAYWECEDGEVRIPHVREAELLSENEARAWEGMERRERS